MSSSGFRDASPQPDVESGYASGDSNYDNYPDVYFTKPHLKYLNRQLSRLEPEGLHLSVFNIL
jgi:phosphoadenosine phosphosulfate reductase